MNSRIFVKFIAIAGLVALGGAACRRDPQVVKQQYVESGDKFFAQKSYAEAIIQYRNALAQDPNLGEARAKLAAAYEASNDLTGALREYVRAADLLPNDVDVQLHAGKLLVAAGLYPEARDRAVAALAKDPKNVNGLIVLGNSLAGLKDIDGAVAQIQGAIDADPSLLFTYLNLSLLELRRGNVAAAEAALKRATEADPKSVPARLGLANFYWSKGDRKSAERELKTALSLDSKSPDVNRVLAAFYFTSNDRASAEPYFKTYAAVSPSVNARLGLADFYVAEKRAPDAVTVLEALSQDKDGFAPAKLRLATIDFGQGHKPQAYKAVDEILTRDPKNEEALELKARFSLSDHNNDEAIKLASAIVTANPQAVRSHFLLGAALVSKGSIIEASKAFRRVLELNPSEISARVELASIDLKRGDAKSAADALRPIVKARPSLATARFLLGQAELLLGNVRAAETHLIPVAASNPLMADAQMWLGRLYATKGDLAAARRPFTRALELQPDSIAALNGLVTIDLVQKNPKAVRAELEPRLARRSNDRDLLFLAGTTYLMMGDVKAAEPLFRKVLELDPTNINAYGRLGSIYLIEKRLDEAKATFEDLSRHQDNKVGAETMVGVILDLQGKSDEALKQYQKVLAFAPEAAVAANNVAWKYAESGENLDVALKLAQAAKAKLPNDAAVTDTLGWIYFKKGLMTLAVSTLLQATQQNPSAPAIHYRLGLAYLKSGDITKAQTSLERALKLGPSGKEADDAKRVLATLKGSGAASNH